jgi:predicted amidohydrolase YtcJ
VRIDAGGGFQNYPDDYQVIEQLAKDQQLTVRIAYNLFTQKPKEELTDFKNWTSSVTLHQGDDYLRHNGAGEMLVFSAADFEDFLEPRPDLPTMEDGTGTGGAPFGRAALAVPLHATYNESISRMLDVFEKVNRDIPFNGLPWFSIMPKPSPRKPSSG